MKLTGSAAELDQVLDELGASSDIPGITAAMIRGGTQTWSGAAGVADPDSGRRMTPATQFAIGSMTKSFVAALVLHLVERGHLALNDAVARYLPPEIDSNGATVEDVLAHRSGIPEHVTARFVAALLDQPSRAWTPAEALRYQVGEPGARGELAYSSTNYILLGLVIERVTGTSVGGAMLELLLGPSGLDRIIYQDAAHVPAGPVAIGLTHLAGPAPLTLRDGSGLLPCRAVATAAGAAGGMAGDAEGLARWAYLLYAGGVLRPDSLIAVKRSDGHGFGSVRFEVNREEALGHPGRIPGYRGILAYLPSLDASCAVLVNTDAQAADPMSFLGSCSELCARAKPRHDHRCRRAECLREDHLT